MRKNFIAILTTYLGKLAKPSPVLAMLEVNQALMALSQLKQMVSLKGHKVPSMNITHYVRMFTQPAPTLEWLIKCNFLPLYYTGNSVSAEEALNAQFYLDNLADDIEGVHERYPIANFDLDAYKAMLPVDKITPYMVLDFRGTGLIYVESWDSHREHMQEVCGYVASHQAGLEKYNRWDIEKDHNPIITVLYNQPLVGSRPFDIPEGYEELHSSMYRDRIDDGCVTTASKTFVRVFKDNK